MTTSAHPSRAPPLNASSCTHANYSTHLPTRATLKNPVMHVKHAHGQLDIPSPSRNTYECPIITLWTVMANSTHPYLVRNLCELRHARQAYISPTRSTPSPPGAPSLNALSCTHGQLVRLTFNLRACQLAAD